MSKKTAAVSLNRSETSVGFAYWLFQLILLPSMLRAINGMLSAPLSEAELNFTFFLINFIAMVCIFRSFLGNSAGYAVSHPVLFLESVVLGGAAYLLLSQCMEWFIHYLMPGFANQNDISVANLSRGSFYLTALGAVVLVPPVEECFYRGLIFRTVYRRSPVAGYLVSIAVFSLVHIVGYLGVYSPLALVLSFLQYIPAGLCLAWSCQRSGTVFAPIVLHALINAYGIALLR